MELSVKIVDADVLRGLIAAAILSEDSSSRPPDKFIESLGDVRLHPHQVSAVRRIELALHEFGGALLCDEVGMGKTFVALAVARWFERRIVVAPSVLRNMWSRQSQLAEVPTPFISFEALSRGNTVAGGFDLVIVDEAHHVRNPATRRYRELSRRTIGSRVLLLSATPIHNKRADLTALLSIFLGSRGEPLSPAALTRCVVRRQVQSAGLDGLLPQSAPLVWKEVDDDDSIPRALLALPPPVPPREGGDGGVLVARSLLRQWCSSDAAFEGALKRRLARSIALSAALESGFYPSHEELSAWTIGEDSLQLAFPELVATAVGSTADLLECVRTHSRALRNLHQSMGPSHPRDAQRASILREIRQAHGGIPVVAFSQYADTVTGLFRQLRADSGVAVLTARGGRIASGKIARNEAIALFAPLANGAHLPRDSERVNLLLTTDLLSEGVNLQDAGVVVHLDLPWTPARLEQRMGRVMRLESRHSRVHAYGIRPHSASELLIRLESTIRAKMREAALHMGAFRQLLPDDAREDLDVAPDAAAPAEIAEYIRATLTSWRRASHATGDWDLLLNDTLTRVAAVMAERNGFLVVCFHDNRYSMLAYDGAQLTESPEAVLGLVSRAAGSSTTPPSILVNEAARTISEFFQRHAVMELTEHEASSVARARRVSLRRISSIVESARPHLRPRVLALAQSATTAILGTLGAGAEQDLIRLAAIDLPDEEWLTRIARYVIPQSSLRNTAGDSVRIIALLLLVPREAPVDPDAS